MIERAAFLERFLLPMIEGGEAHIGAPLGFAGLAQFALEGEGEGGECEQAVSSARWAVARELLVDAEPPRLDEDALRIAIAVHDLLFLAHPGGPDLARGEGHRRVAAGCVALVAGLDSSSDPAELVARHTLVHRLPQAVRVDVRVSFWAGRRDFRGQEPPPRLRAWPSVRRVSEERWRIGCLAEAATDTSGGADAARTLLRASPLTDLLNPLRTDPPFDLAGWDNLAAALRSPAVCRIVAYRWLDEGIERCGAALASALLQRFGGRSRDDATMALSLLAHLHLCLVVGSERGRAALLTAAAQEDAGLSDFCGLFAALFDTAPAHAVPPDVLSDGALLSRCAGHAAACAAVCGAARQKELRTLVARAFPDHRDAPRAAPLLQSPPEPALP